MRSYIRETEHLLSELLNPIQIKRIQTGIDAQAVEAEIVKYGKRPVRFDEAAFSSDNTIVRVAKPMNLDPEILQARGHQ